MKNRIQYLHHLLQNDHGLSLPAIPSLIAIMPGTRRIRRSLRKRKVGQQNGVWEF
jgi:hypothetical protein